jgi:hypothetical protein
MSKLLGTVVAVDKESLFLKLVPRTPAIWPSEWPKIGELVDVETVKLAEVNG